MYLENLMLLGKKQRMWINKFKVALIQKDADALNTLLDEVPNFTNKEDIEQTMYLMREALELIHTLKDETSLSMKQIKKNIDFLGSSLSQASGSLNLRS